MGISFLHTTLPAGRRWAVRAGLWALAALVAANVVVSSPLLGSRMTGSTLSMVLMSSVSALSASLMFARARLVPSGRLPWILFGFGIVVGVAANFYSAAVLPFLDPRPFPSWADAGWLAPYPLAYVAIALLLRARVAHWHASTWLDGLVASCGLGAVAIAWVFDKVLVPKKGSIAHVATALAYPSAALLILVLLVGAFGVLGWRVGAVWWLVTGSVAWTVLGNVVYLFQAAAGTYRIGSWLDVTWVFGIALLAPAAWARSAERAPRKMGDWALLAVPLLFATTSLVLLVVAGLSDGPDHRLVVWLAGATICLALARTTLTLREVRSLGEARRQARTDDLTNLPNRRALLEELAEAESIGPSYALLLIDLDRFKEINDSFGHPVGDRLLRMVGARLSRVLDEEARLSRMGGDEFAVLLRGADGPTATRVAREMNAVLRDTFVLDGMPMHIEASIGISLAPTHGSTPALLLQRADLAMYKAKRAGIGCAIYEPGEAGDARNRRQTLEELRTALVTGQLVVHFQPKLELATGRVVGAEALVRWQHPTRGLLYPDGFLPLAEQAGLMRDIAREVLGQSLRAVRSWREAGHDLHVAVNLSVSDLQDTALPAQVRALLDAHDVPARALVLEITENVLMADAARSQLVLTDLRALGVRLAVDDYGTGYSSLSYLHELPVDELKLDRSFVTHLSTDRRAAAIVRSTVQLAHDLGMVMLAEGVEDAQVLDSLTAWRCDLAQGYHIARPMAPELFEPWLAAHSAAHADLPR